MDRLLKLLLNVLILANVAAAAQWTRVTEIPAEEFLSLYSDGKALYAGGTGTIYFIADCDSSWRPLTKLNNDADNVATILKTGNRLFAGSWNEGLFESTDNGITWIPRNSGLSETGASVPMDMAVRGDSLYVATMGASVHVMDLGGTGSWSPYRSGLDFGIAWNVESIVNHNDVLITGAGANGLVYARGSDEPGWSEYRFSEFAGEQLSMLDMLSYQDKVYGVAHNGLYVSSDSGKTWEQYLTSIGLLSTGDFAEGNGKLFAMVGKSGLLTRIYQRIGDSWVLFDEIPLTTGNAIAVYCDKIFLARLDGLYSAPLNPTDVPEHDPVLPTDFELSQNYPNPFNPSTSIEFTLKRPSRVRITVLNILGQQVAALIEENLAAGMHKVDWNGCGEDGRILSTGVYFYRLESDGFKQTRKMMLMK